jgi:glycosyltransferase involved in cell wall biosynthesis
MTRLKIVVDTKNFALYGGGIAHWFAPLLAAWIEHRSDAQFLLLGPTFNTGFLPRCGNWEREPITWPQWLPRPLRHPWYDNILFPRAVTRLRPNLALSPYHDVRIPKGVPSVIGVHDLCLDELVTVYPRRIRLYYLALLRSNLRRASHVITVSQTSRDKLTRRYGVLPQRISVVYNASSPHFGYAADANAVTEFKRCFAKGGRFVLYPGGSEFRKNVNRLAESFAQLAQTASDLILLVTGSEDQRWSEALVHIPTNIRDRVVFSGKLSDAALRLAYAASDAVVYPSLCEGFGRVCLEAMEAGAPLACSDLPVMREVAGNYACYFDPFDAVAMTNGIYQALMKGRCNPVRDPRFSEAAVRTDFLTAMDSLMTKLEL